MSDTAQQQTNVLLLASMEKSAALAFALTLFFGPLGLLYASPAGGLILFLVAIPLCAITFGLGIGLVWPISMAWALIATAAYNVRLEATLKPGTTPAMRE